MPRSINILRLKELREKHGLTQAALSERIKRSRRTIERIENGASCSLTTIRKIAETLEVVPGDLLLSEVPESSASQPTVLSQANLRAQPSAVSIPGYYGQGSRRVFLSSTLADLRPHRQRVIDSLVKAGFTVSCWETESPAGDGPGQFVPDLVANSDLVVLLVGQRRGVIPPGSSRSIVQMEHDYAVERGLDVLVFLQKESAEEKGEEAEALKAWRKELRRTHPHRTFEADPSSLSVDVEKLLVQWQQRREQREKYRRYLDGVCDEFARFQFQGLALDWDEKQLSLPRLFVSPRLHKQYLSPDSSPPSWDESEKRIALRDCLRNNPRTVVLGDPGTGKSTIVSWIAWSLAHRLSNPWQDAFPQMFPVPFILRDLKISEEVNWEKLLNAFLHHRLGCELSRKDLDDLLKNGRAFVMLDGIDEVGNRELRRRLRAAVWEGMDSHRDCRWLFASRVTGYEEVSFDAPPLPRELQAREIQAREIQSQPASLEDLNVHFNPSLAEMSDDDAHPMFLIGKVRMGKSTMAAYLSQRWFMPLPRFYVAPFDDRQIRRFAVNWFRARESGLVAQEKTNEFLKAVRGNTNTHRLGRIPQLLMLMASIHHVDTVLPDGQAKLYDRITDTYLHRLPEARGLDVFTEDVLSKRRWLAYVGFQMQVYRTQQAGVKEEGEGQAVVVPENILRTWITEAMALTGRPNPEQDAAAFLEFVRVRAGLLIERGREQFAFVHLSFQEYFAACYLLELLTKPEWLLGEDTSALPLEQVQKFLNQSEWQATFVYFFEKLVQQFPSWSKRLRQTLLGKAWEDEEAKWKCKDGQEMFSKEEFEKLVLLLRLSEDRYVRFDQEKGLRGQETLADLAIRACCRWDIARQQETEGKSWRHEDKMLKQLLTVPSKRVPTRIEGLVCAAEEANARTLTLSGTAVTDLKPLEKLAALQELYLGGTGVRDLKPLEKLTKLQILSLNATGVKDLKPLEKLTRLQTLILILTKVADLKPLEKLTELKWLSLSDTAVSDLKPLEKLTRLQMLVLNFTKITDLKPLEKLTELQELYLSDTAVMDLEPLENLTRLRELYLERTRVRDLKPLRKLSDLKWLSLSGAGVTDLTPLEKLTKLQMLYLSDTGAKYLEPLEKLTGLQTLYLNGTAVENLKPLEKLTELQTLYLTGTPVSEQEIQRFRRAMPEVEVYYSRKGS